MAKALVLVDFQNEWADKSSDYHVRNISGIAERARRLLDFCRKKGFKIIFTMHIEDDPDGAFAPGSFNSRIMGALKMDDSDVLVKKNRINPFYRTSLEEDLEGIDEIYVCGILTNLCVRMLVEEAYDRDFGITIVEDCCASFENEVHDFTLRDLKSTREEIEIISSEDVISS